MKYKIEVAIAKMKLLGNEIVESTYIGWSKPCTIIFKDGSMSSDYSPYEVNTVKYRSVPKQKIGRHTFETADAKMKMLGNKIVESTYKGWNKPCTIIFSDGSESSNASPYKVNARNHKSKIREKVGKHTFKSANTKMEVLGNKIVESTYKGWCSPCTIIFNNGEECSYYEPRKIYERKYRSPPRRRIKEHTFETANEKVKELGGRILEGTFTGWEKPCSIIRDDGTESNTSPKKFVMTKKIEPKPKGKVGYTIKDANAEMQLLGNKIIESTYNGWCNPCTIVFSDGTESTVHSPSMVKAKKITSKPSRKGYVYSSFEKANAAMMSLGNKIVEGTFVKWGSPCTIIFSDGTESSKYAPDKIFHKKIKTKPRRKGNTLESLQSELNALGNKIVESTFKHFRKTCTIIFNDGTKSDRYSPYLVLSKKIVTSSEKPNVKKFSREKISEQDAENKMNALGNRIVDGTFNGWNEPCTIVFSDGSYSREYSPHTVEKNQMRVCPIKKW